MIKKEIKMVKKAIKSSTSIKTSNSRVESRNEQRNSPFSKDFMGGESMWVGEERLKKLAESWQNETWSNEDIDDPYEYLLSVGITPRQARLWCSAHEFFQEAFDTVKEIIFLREHKKLRESDPNERRFMLTDYRPEYKDVYEWKAGFRAKAQPSQETYMPVQSAIKVKHD
jgi:hypothetical protein